MASSQRTINQTAGTPPTIGIDVGERTHYAHARYAMINEAGVIWYDPRDGREKFRVPNVVADTDLALDERVLTHVTIHPKRAMCQVVDSEEHEWVVEYQIKTRELFERPPDLPDREYTAHYAKSETYDTVRAARSAAGDRCEAYADAAYRNAVDARTTGELVTDGGVDQDDGDAAQRTRHQYFARADAECSRWNCSESAWFRLVTWNGWPCEFCPQCAAEWDRDGIAQIDTEFHSQNPTLVADGGVGCHEADSTDDTDLPRANPEADADSMLPEIRFVDRFSDGNDVFYAAREENGVRLYRVTGKTTIARSLLAHDAVIHDTAGDACITTPSYEERYKTIDLNHHMAGRKASIRADRILDEPVITLAEVDRV